MSLWQHLVLLLCCLPLHMTPVNSQPSFDECKIFLVASDTARDLSLNREPEFIRFLNLIARIYTLPSEFQTYDNLPMELKSVYKAYAWTKYNEIDISAAQFGADVPDEEVDVLKAFCNETTKIVANLVPTKPPTPAPTATATQAPSLPRLSFDVDTADTLVMSISAAVSDLPIQCRRAMFGSDSERDGFLFPDEYTMFTNRMSSNAYSHAGTFDALPKELQENFDNLADEGRIDIFGAIPSQWAQATPQQRAFLQLICYRTEAALVAAHEAKQNLINQTATTPDPTTASPTLSTPNSTVAPTAHQNATNENTNSTPAVNATPPITTSPNENVPHYQNEGFEDNRRRRNVIAAIVGSVLIVMLGLYLARDKQDGFKVFVSNVYSNLKTRLHRIQEQRQRNQRRRRQNAKISPAMSTDTGIMTSDYKSNNGYRHPHPDFRRRHDLYDVESQQHERTGFLEDLRVGAPSVVLPVSEEAREDYDIDDKRQARASRTRKSDGSSSYGFKIVRDNTKEFTTQPYDKRSYTMRFNPDDYLPEENQDEKESKDREEDTNYDANVHQLDQNDIGMDTDQENMINEDFKGYRFDDATSSDSSAMSLYCNSLADEGNRRKTGQTNPSSTGKKQVGKKKPLQEDTTQERPLEAIASPRRGSKTMYHANRFGPIAQSESAKPNSARSIQRNSGDLKPSQSPRVRRQISARRGSLATSSHHQKAPTTKTKTRRHSATTRHKPQRALARPPPIKRVSAKKHPWNQTPSCSSLDEPSVQSREQSLASRGNKEEETPGSNSPGRAEGNRTCLRQQKKDCPTPSRTVHFKEVEEKKPMDRFLRYAMDESSTESSDPSGDSSYTSESHAGSISRQEGTMEDVSEAPERHRTIPISLSDEEEVTQTNTSSKQERLSDSLPLQPEPVPGRSIDDHNDGKNENVESAELSVRLSPTPSRPAKEEQFKKKRIAATQKSPNQLQRTFERTILAESKGQATPKSLRETGKSAQKSGVHLKTVDVEKTPLMDDDTMSLSSFSAFEPQSPITSITKDLVRGDSDSTYYGTASETSSTFPPESSTSESFALPKEDEQLGCKDDAKNGTAQAHIEEIRELVAIVMPSEQEKITQMLEQYQGREIVLLQTLRRLEARSSARRRRGSVIYAAGTNRTREHKASPADTAKEVLRRTSVVTENAELHAAAATVGQGGFLSRDALLTGGSERSEKTTMLDLETDLEEDDYSQDSTYVEEEDGRESGVLGADDSSWSVFSASLR